MQLLNEDCFFCRAFLRDLVESTHLFLKMLEHYATKHSHLVVQKKKKKNKKRKNKGKNKCPFLDVLMKFAEYSSTSLHAMNILFPFC